MTRSSNPRMPLTLAAATALMPGLGGHATAQQPVPEPSCWPRTGRPRARSRRLQREPDECGR